MRILVLIAFMCSCFLVHAQSWPTVGGNNQRNGLSRMPGPADLSDTLWTAFTSNFTAWGNTVLVQGDRFVCARIRLSPEYLGLIECRSVHSGELLWEFEVPGGRLYAVGFDEYAVYVHDYATNDLYSLRPDDGEIRWKHPEPINMFGGTGGLVFACNGDPVSIGKRIDRYSGETVWETDYVIPVSPDAGYAVLEEVNRYYHWTGSIFTPKKLIALDMDSGDLLFESEELPGEGDQEYPLTVGPQGHIYIRRDGGDLYAFEDLGNGFNKLWNVPLPVDSRIACGPDSSLYYYAANRIFRVSPADGSVLDSSDVTVTTEFRPVITVDPDGRVYVANGSFGSPGKYLCFNASLDSLLWESQVSTNYYSGIAPAANGVVILTGSGGLYRALRAGQGRAPVADFDADTLQLGLGGYLKAVDRSSFSPDSWEWQFPGGMPSTASGPGPIDVQYTQPGLHDIGLIVHNAVGSDTLWKHCVVSVSTTVGVESTTAASVLAFPNPATSWFRVNAPSGTKLRLWKDGVLLKEQPAEYEIEVPASWPNGIYLLQAIEPGGAVYWDKVAVMR